MSFPISCCLFVQCLVQKSSSFVWLEHALVFFWSTNPTMRQEDGAAARGSWRGTSLNAVVSKNHARTIDKLFMENMFEKFMQWQRECSHLLIKLQSQEQEEELKDRQNPWLLSSFKKKCSLLQQIQQHVNPSKQNTLFCGLVNFRRVILFFL